MATAHRKKRSPDAGEFYRRAMQALHEAEVPFLVGGAYALAHYTGIERDSKDLDLFLRRADLAAATAALHAIGCRIELTFDHWLGKARHEQDFIDLLFSSGNGVVAVDDGWFEHAPASQLLGVDVRICPVEETLWSKSFVMERERYDGADMMHLLRATADTIDWPRLTACFGPHWRVLLSYLVLFGFVYPSERHRIPPAVLEALTQRLAGEARSPAPERVCQGALLSREQYLVDLDVWGYADPRLPPLGGLTVEEVRAWTAAIWEGEGD